MIINLGPEALTLPGKWTRHAVPPQIRAAILPAVKMPATAETVLRAPLRAPWFG